MENERWLPIKGFENYEVSNHGRVRTIPHYQPVRGGEFALHPGGLRKLGVSKKDGRLGLCLAKDGKAHSFRVHILVLEAFVSPRPPGLLGLHRDDDKSNNHVENLYWGTYSDNANDAVKNRVHWQVKKTECKHGHPLDGRVGDTGRRYCKTCAKLNSREQHRKNPRPLAEMPYGRPRLTNAQREKIKVDPRTLRAIAEDYSITHTTVRRIKGF